MQSGTPTHSHTLHLQRGILHAEFNQYAEDAQLFEDVSELIKIFRKLMQVSDNIIFCLQNEEDCKSYLETLKGIIADIERFALLYNYAIKNDSPHRNTCYRFICRLIETLSSYRNRNYLAKGLSAIFYNYTLEIQSVMMSYREEHNIGSILHKLNRIIIRFVDICERIANNSHTVTVQNSLWKLTEKEKDEVSRKEQRTKQEQKIAFSQSSSNFNKMLTGLNRRFTNFGCGDLDYNNFKTSYFRSRNQQDEFFQEYYERNQLIMKEITIYSRQFSEYLKRKEKKSMLGRKNRFKMERLTRERASYSKNKAKLDKNHSLSDQERQENYFKQPSTNTEKVDEGDQQQQSKDEPSEQNEHKGRMQAVKRKTSYQLKQVVITLSKPPQPSVFHVQFNTTTTGRQLYIKKSSHVQKIATRSIQKNKKSPAVFNRKIITQYGEEIERKVFADNPESVPNFITLPNGTPRCSPINLDQTVSIFRAKNMHMHDTLGHKFMPIVPVKDKTNTSDRKNLSDRKNSIRISYMPYRASDKHMNGNYTAHKKTTCQLELPV